MSTIFTLSNEILQMVTSLLQNRDIKNLRLTSKRLQANSLLRFERVFLSPNKRNIEVLGLVAEHSGFRAQVKEIVWDDALLQDWNLEDNDEYDDFGEQRWQSECMFNGTAAELVSLREPRSDIKLLSQDENIAIYHRLYAEQQEIITAGLDAEALREYLPKFPALMRVTVTPATYKPSIRSPYLATPMIRSFSPSFNFPTPWGWKRSEEEDPEEMSWEDGRETWHGLTVVLRELARSERPVLELVLDVNREPAGVSYQLFREPSEDLQRLHSICSRGLQRLDLSIAVAYFQFHPGLEILPSSRLKETIEAASAMQSFSLHTDAGEGDAGAPDFDGQTDVLKAIPLESWPHLRHLGLSHLPLFPTDLISFLERLPSTIESVEFVELSILPKPLWREMLQEMKDKLKWTGNKPKVTVAFEFPGMAWRKNWASDSIARFLDGDGENPFIENADAFEREKGVYTTRDDFDESVNEQS